MYIRTNLFTALLTCLVLTMAGSCPAAAQQNESDNDQKVILSLSTEKEWTNSAVVEKCDNKTHWERYYYAVGPGEAFIINLPKEMAYDVKTIEGEFSNGITGVGDKHFEVWGNEPGSSDTWKLLGTIAPGTSRGGQFNFKSLICESDQSKWTKLKFIYKRGANLSTGGIKSLKIGSDRYADENIAPQEMHVSNIDTASALISWSGSKYPFDQKSIYHATIKEISSHPFSLSFSFENTNHFQLSNLKPNMDYDIDLERSYDGDTATAKTLRFKTLNLKSPYVLANVFDTCSLVQSEKKYENIAFLRGEDVLVFHLNAPVSSIYMVFEQYVKNHNDLSFTATYYDKDDKELWKQAYQGTFTIANSYPQVFERAVPEGTTKVRVANLNSNIFRLLYYKFPVVETWLNGKGIEVIIDDADEMTVDLKDSDPSLRAAQEPLVIDGKELTLHLALFQSELDGNEAVQLFDRPLTAEEIKQQRCLSGQRMNPELLYTAYLYYTVDDACYDMIWKSFTRADVATGNETIPMAVDNIDVRCEERRVYITRPEAMTGILQLTDFTGRHITGQRLRQTTEASFEIEQPGNYIVRLILSDGVISRKISVK